MILLSMKLKATILLVLFKKCTITATMEYVTITVL